MAFCDTTEMKFYKKSATETALLFLESIVEFVETA